MCQAWMHLDGGHGKLNTNGAGSVRVRLPPARTSQFQTEAEGSHSNAAEETGHFALHQSTKVHVGTSAPRRPPAALNS